MSLLVQCPFCPAKVNVHDAALTATCPKCFKTFSTASGDDDRPAGARSDADASNEGDDTPEWINRWGVVSFGVSTVGFLAASVIGIWLLTIGLAGLGIAAACWGFVTSGAERKVKDVVWLSIGGLVSAGVLGVTLMAPGLLNRFWAMDQAVPEPDLQKIVIVPRDAARSEGRPLEKDEAADATREAVRQADVVARIDSVMMGRIKERPGKDYILIHVRLSSASNERRLLFKGFATDKHTPTLKDASGKSFAFLEQRPRKLGAGPPHVFLTAAPEDVDVSPGRYLDYQLVFEPPPASFSALTLELPASAWGRKSVFRLRIAGLFEASLPEIKK